MADQKGGVRLSITDDQIRNIIKQDQPKLLVEQAEEIGRALSQSLTKSQIRNIFGTVRQIQMNWTGETQKAASYRQLLMLKPKLQYQAARTKEVGPLADVLDKAIDHVQDDRVCFGRFVDFFEAILAYHTAYGGK
jgi:CRISPR-associated protein Csm2